MNTTDYGLNTAAYDYPNVILSNSTLYIPAHALVDLPTLTASNSLASVTSTISEYVVKDQTYTVTEILLGSTTVTITAPPSTITVYQPPITTTTTVTVAPNATETASTWSMPSHITDLSPFNVTKYSGGTSNINIVTGIPSSASASPTPIAISMSISPESSEVTFYEELEYSDWRNDTSALQLFYPENSVNPGRRPIGGAQFYATPIDLDNVELKLVSLTYSVFFPVDFDFVLGGKLPGLYGGRAGCSGGDEALDCFSTRLMWRKNGLGELYLVSMRSSFLAQGAESLSLASTLRRMNRLKRCVHTRSRSVTLHMASLLVEDRLAGAWEGGLRLYSSFDSIRLESKMVSSN